MHLVMILQEPTQKEDIMDNITKTVGEKNNVVILMHDASDKILTYETLKM